MMGSRGEDRRARRAAQRRQGILEAAARVFGRKGFDRATTREIALEADVSEGTIYNYFASKTELLLALSDTIQTKFEAVVATVLSEEGRERAGIVEAVERALAIIADNVVVIRGLVAGLWDQDRGFRGYLIPGGQDLIRQVGLGLEKGVRGGIMRPCDVQVVARMVMGMVTFLTMPYLRGFEPTPSVEVRAKHAELLVSVLLDGLLLPEDEH